MDFDGLKTGFDNCEAKYLRRSVGNALNECLAEILYVRPPDPIEYMGLWLYRFADNKNYFKKKKMFYEELLATKIDIDNKKIILIQKQNEAILDITAPLTQPDQSEKQNSLTPNAESTSDLENKKEPTSDDKKRGSRSSTSDNAPHTESDLSDNSSLSRGLAPKFRDAASSKLSSKNSRTKTHGKQPEPPPKGKKYKPKVAQDNDEVADEDDDNWDFQSSLKLPYFIEDRNSGIEVAPARWKVSGHRIICHHPVLGAMAIQKRKSSFANLHDFDIAGDLVYESMYDPELYIHETSFFDLLSPLVGKRSSRHSDFSDTDGEDVKTTSDFNDVNPLIE